VIELIRPDTNFDFIGKWKICMAVSAAIILIGIAAIPIRGLRWGIDFAGGAELLVRFDPSVAADEGKVRAAVESAGVSEPSVVRYGEEGGSFLIRFSGATGSAEGENQAQFVDHLKNVLGEKVGTVSIDRVDFVGPKVGAELRRGGIKAFAIAFLLIGLYVASRFAWAYAPGCVVALVHDVLVTSAIWVVLGQSFDLQILAALLAIVGYSLNDTIIIYDRIREVMGVHTAKDLPEVINRSVNQTLSRTLLTSSLTMVTVLALLFLGGSVIRPFAGAMTIGIVVGSYSSIYIAAPIMLILSTDADAKKGAPAKRAGKPGRKQAKARA